MERAVNPQTGEVVFLVDNQWVKPTQTAQNPQTGETAYLVGNSWKVVQGIKKPEEISAPIVSPEEMLTPLSQTDTAAPIVKPGGFQSELLSEQFKAGVSGLQEGYYANTAKNNAALLNIMDRIDRGEQIRPIDDPLGYADMDAITRKTTRDALQSALTGTVAKTISYGAERQGYKRNENADLLVSLADKGDLKGAFQVFTQDPIGIIQQLSVESAPNALPSLVGGAAGILLKGGVAGLMTGLATGSFPVEFMASITDSLRESGVNLKDAKAVEAKLRDPKFLEDAGKRAVTRGTVIATADAASGKLLMPFKAGQLGKNAARAIGNVGTEAGVEMVGEAAAQAASGEELKLGQVIAEGLGSGPQAAVATALRSITESGKLPETTRPSPSAEEIKPESKRVEPTMEGLPTRKGPATAPEVEDETEAIQEAVKPSKPGLPETKEEALAFLDTFSKALGEDFDEADKNEFLQRWEKARAAEGLTPSEELESAGQGVQREVKAESPDTQTYIQKMLPVEVPVANLKLSKDVPQFKSDANEQGVVERLGGKFEREGLAPIQVWRRNNGDLEVISGRHRLDLARRSGEATIPAQIFNESDGFDAKRAAVMDAELNIRDEKGKVKDYVTYFKETKLPQDEAESRGLLARSVGKRAYTIANEGSEELITALRNDALTDEGAFIIAKNAPNDGRLQAVGIQAIQKGLGIGAAANKMQALKALAGEADTSIDMFGFDTGALKEAEEMGKIADRKQREIGTRLAAISGAAKNPKLAKQEGIDIRDENAVARRVEELRQLKASWENWPTNPDLREEIRAEMRPAEAKVTPAPKIEAKVEKPKEKISFYYDLLPEAGFKRLDIEDPRTYKNKSGEPFITYERDGVRVAFSSNNILYADERGRVGAYTDEPENTVFRALIVDPKERRKGKATQAVSEIVQMADKSGTNLYMEPASLDTEGMTTPQLKEFYKQFGFEPQKLKPKTEKVLVRMAGEKIIAEAPKITRKEEKRKAAEEAKEAEKREEKAIADREVDLFKLQPTIQDLESAPTGDLFGAKDLLTQPPKRPPILDEAVKGEGLFAPPEVFNEQYVRELATVKTGDLVDGYEVLDEIPNRGSIAASLEDYEILDGIRQVPFAAFEVQGKPDYGSKTEEADIKDLADQIKKSGKIKPLIVVQDEKGLYILEGGHRWDALRELGARSFPALVVIDKDRASTDKATKEESQYLETVVKDTLKKLEEDFMVGDMVRIGNSPGVIVGIEGDYVRVHPDNADNPKAYRRVQKNLVTFVARPDTKPTVALSTQKDQDQKFGIQKGRLDADMGGLIQLLGANMYASNIADVAIKELLQNAFDAVKGAVSDKKAPSLYKSGKIDISINTENRTITVKDNARGMTPEIVQNAFFTVAGSDKSDLDPQERSGGLGLAKMGFMLGSEQLKLETVRDGVKVTVDTTAKDIANSNFDIKKSPAKKGEHGTSVTVKIPEKYIDPKNGEERHIWFFWGIDKIDFLKKPLIGPADVTIEYTDYSGTEKKTLPAGINFPENKYQKLKVNFDWGSADVYFGIERKERPDHQVLSSGVYQFDERFMLNQQEVVPYDIVVNIKSNVEAKHPDYPFENSRERFKRRLEKDVKALTAYVGQLARGNEMADLQDTFKNIVSMPRTEVGKETAETAKKLKKSFEKKEVEKFELPPFPQEVRVTGDLILDTKGTVIVDVAKEEEKKREASFKAETEAPTREEFMLDIPQDPRNPIFHNNTNLDLIEIGEKYGKPMQFFSELGTLMIEMKEALAKSPLYGYELLKPENLFFAGVAIDKKYGGVHIKVPYKAVLINPFYDWGAKTLFGVRANIFTTMVHEIAHTGSMDHGVAHNEQMIRVEQFLEDSGLADYFRDAILDVLVRHESTFTAMREAYGQSTTQNTGKSLEDYDKSKSAAASRRVEPSGEGEDWFTAAGEGQERTETVRARGRRDKESGVGGTAGENVRKLLDETGRINTPMLEHAPTKRAILNVAQDSKNLVNEAIENPMAVVSNMAGSVDRGILYLRNKNIWFGSGLNAADFSQYNGQLRTSQGLATASVALDNAIRGGNIYVQVVMEGGIEWNEDFQNFIAATRPYSMKNVYKAEADLKKKIGSQTGQDLIQGYLEAKRSRSIQNEYYKRQEEVQLLEEAIDQTVNPDSLKQLRKDLIDAQEDLERITIVFDKIAMTDEVIDEFIAQEKKFPDLRAIMDNWTDVNQNLLRFWRQTGVLSEKRYMQLAAIQDYVPWQRIMSVEEDPHSPVQSTTKTMTNVGKERLFKKGTPKVTTSFIAKEDQKSFRIQPSSVVSATVNGNKVPADKFVVDSDGKVQLNVPIKAGDVVVFDGIREIENIIDNMTRNVGMMVMNGLRNYAGVRIATEYGTKNEQGKLKTFKRPDRNEGIFNVLIDGRRVNVQVPDPLIAEAAIGMETMNIEAVRIFGAIANITRRSITLSGAFQLKQVFKDAPTAALVTGVKRPDLLIGGVYKGFVTALTQSDPAFDILRKAGIGGFHSPARTPEAEVKRQIGIINRSTYDWTISLLDRFGDSADYAQRIATFNRVLKETGDPALALFQAANVINFLHHGSGQLAQAAVRTVPFMGAYANSIDVLAQAAAGGGMKGMSRAKALKRIAVTGGLLTGVTLLYCMLLGADDDYWELDDETRLKNFIVPFLRASDGSMIMLPMNTSAAFFFKAIPELIYHKVITSGTNSEPDARRLRKALANSAADTLLGPTPVAAGIKPAIEIGLNYNFFTGRQVVPRGLENEEAWQQYTSSTSELGKFLSAATGGFVSKTKRVLNPIEADHMIRGLFGSAGAMAQWSSNVIHDAVTGDERRPAMTVREMPIVGGFVTPPVPRGKEDLFYDFKALTDQKYETFMSLVNRQEKDAAKKYLEENKKLIGYHDYTNEVDAVLKEINAEIRRVGEIKIGEGSPLTAEGKRDKITRLQMKKNQALKNIQKIRNDAMKEVAKQE
jgi:GNAT superfamily N-acetyltransferase